MIVLFARLSTSDVGRDASGTGAESGALFFESLALLCGSDSGRAWAISGSDSGGTGRANGSLESPFSIVPLPVPRR